MTLPFFVSPLTGKTHDFVLVYGRVCCGVINYIESRYDDAEEIIWFDDSAFDIDYERVEKECVQDGLWPLQEGDRVCIVNGLVDRNGTERQRIFMVEVYREGFVPPEPPKVDIGTGM
jgi:hypothetical protein